jgi:hypothetical protein
LINCAEEEEEEEEEEAVNVNKHELRYAEVSFGKYWRKKWERAKFGNTCNTREKRMNCVRRQNLS